MATHETPRPPDPTGPLHQRQPAGPPSPPRQPQPAGPADTPIRPRQPQPAGPPSPNRQHEPPSPAQRPGPAEPGGPSVVTRGRAEVLGRLRTALADRPRPPVIPRDYRHSGDGSAGMCDDTDRGALVDQLTDRLVDYRASVYPCTPGGLADTLGALLADVERLAVPGDLPKDWLTGYRGVLDVDPAEVATLDRADAVLTGCAVAIAETGTIVLDAGAAQGRRALTLVPDRHLCVVRADQVVTGVPEGLAALADPTRPLTFISGPSATSDIELSRVEGVHGPRRLQVILVLDTA